MRWRAFYADGRRLASVDGPWVALPTYGLVVAVWWDAEGRRHLECGDDALIHVGTTIVGVNLPTPAFVAAAGQEAARGWLKYGAYLAPDVWAAVGAEAEDARVPPER